MKKEIEKVLLEFEHEIKSNPELRIEDFKAVNEVLESINQSEKDELFRELIFLETDYRFETKQSFEATEYEQRFPRCIKHIDHAFKLLDQKIVDAQESSGFELINVTQKYSGGYFVNPINTAGNEKSIKLPRELGKYSQIERVGQGGFGVVCRALDTETNELRALKFPKGLFSRNDEYLDTVREETEKSIGLDHPYVVRTFGMDVIEPFAFVVQEFVDGGNLSEWIKQDHTIRKKVEMMARIARGLHYAHAHEKEVTHCDIKPANILVDSEGNPKITDFGLSFHEKDRLGLPLDGWGTPAYLAPEVLEGYFRFSDGRADIFSLGVIFYEMLAGRRPFVHVDSRFLVEEIKYKTPKSIRLLKPKVDRELERICFRCLQKKTLDRYQLASDLELELREWLAEPKSTPAKQHATRFVPRGLRSFKVEDAAFFQELLPGVRDQGNIPISLTFWSKRICEPVPTSERVANGFLFGPSGSGKSSFVKAGLIPLIQQHVEPVYVEATGNDTEVRILKSLRNIFPDIPNDRSLPEVFAGLSNGKWRVESKSKKILLVLDQFEQWITRDEQYDQAQLTHGLRHCDGENLQCLMLVRDDFIFACSRFADALDINLLENENYQDIDLFDESHAKKILMRYGQAYGKLPPEELMRDEQFDFIHQTIDQLARNHYVVCVRLTLFAEMFKDREWTVEELNSVGGVAGVGEQFLESRFGDGSANTLFRANRKRVQAVLEGLLPDAGRDIRGGMKTRDELIAAAQCESNERTFEEIIQILHDQLKLITRTDPDASGDTTVNENISPDGKVYYQLTHDYLVPSIRNWLNTQHKNTSGGRALIRLRELATQVVPGQKPKYLPSNLEWVYWGMVLRSPAYSEKEKTVLKTARNRFWRHTGILVICLVILMGSYYFWAQHSRSETLSQQILERPYDSLPALIQEYRGIQNSTDRIQKKAAAGKMPEKESQLRVALVSKSSDEETLQYIINGITDPLTNAKKLNAIAEVIEMDGRQQDVADKLFPLLDDVSLDPEQRFRAGAAIAKLEKAQVDWNSYSGLMSQILCVQPGRDIEGWIDALSGIKGYLLNDLKSVFKGSANPLVLANCAEAIFQFEDSVSAWDLFLTLLLDSNAEQFDAILDLAVAREGVGLLQQRLESLRAEQLSESERATIAIAMARLGFSETFFTCLSGNSSRTVRNYTIVMGNKKRIHIHRLIQLLETHLAKDDPLARQAILLMLANQVPSVSDASQLSKVQSIARNGYLDTSSASCFAAYETILKRLPDGWQQIQDLRRQRRANLIDSEGIKGNVLINSALIPFSIIEVRETNGDLGKLAISSHEVINREVAEIIPDLVNKLDNNKKHLPFLITDVRQVEQICSELNDQEKRTNIFQSMKGKSERFLTEMSFDESANGYRLLAEHERKQVREMTGMEYGEENELAKYFCQVYQNTEGNIAAAGQLFPNEIGLFDVFGNCQELTLSVVNAKIDAANRFGSTCRSNASEIRTEASKLFQISGCPELTFRLVRKIK